MRPKILATCKAVYNEAYPDFEKNSHLSVTIEGGIEKDNFEMRRINGQQLYASFETVSYSIMGNQPKETLLTSYEKLASFRATMVDKFVGAHHIHLKLKLRRVEDGVVGSLPTQQDVEKWYNLSEITGKLLLGVCSALRHHNVQITHLGLVNETIIHDYPMFNPKRLFRFIMWPICCLSGVDSCTMTGIPAELKTSLLDNTSPNKAPPDVLADCERRILHVSNLSGLLKRAGVVKRGGNPFSSLIEFYKTILGRSYAIPSIDRVNKTIEDLEEDLNRGEVQLMKATALARLEPEEAAMWAKVT